MTGLARTSFPVPIRSEVYVMPTIAIALAAAAATAIVYFLAGVTFASRMTPGVDQLFTAFGVAAPLLAAVMAAGVWIERKQRIHRERKLILDVDGITYVAFAGHTRLMRWDEFRRIDEQQSRAQEGGSELIYELAGGSFVVHERDFHGYQQIRRMTRERLPDRTTLLRRR